MVTAFVVTAFWDDEKYRYLLFGTTAPQGFLFLLTKALPPDAAKQTFCSYFTFLEILLVALLLCLFTLRVPSRGRNFPLAIASVVAGHFTGALMGMTAGVMSGVFAAGWSTSYWFAPTAGGYAASNLATEFYAQTILHYFGDPLQGFGAPLVYVTFFGLGMGIRKAIHFVGRTRGKRKPLAFTVFSRGPR